jgi:hypothetical protein
MTGHLQIATHKHGQNFRNYPQQLFTYLGSDAPVEITITRQNPLELRNLLALLCSTQAPASVLLAVHDSAQQWRHGEQVIVRSLRSPGEVLAILLRGPGRAILCLARGLPKRIAPGWCKLIADGCVTFLSPFPDSMHRAAKETATCRNRFLAATADTVLIAYAHPGSSTEQLAKEVLGWNKRIYTLSHESTAALQNMGVSILQQ